MSSGILRNSRMPRKSLAVGPRLRSSEDLSVLQAADEEAAGNRKRMKYRDVPKQAREAIQNRFDEMFLKSLRNKKDRNGCSMQELVEAEIIRQGGTNFKIAQRFWSGALAGFELQLNPVDELPAPDLDSIDDEECEDTPQELIDGMAGLLSDNNCMKGKGFKIMQTYLDGNPTLNAFYVHQLVDGSFRIVAASKLFMHRVQFLVADFFLRNAWELVLVDVWQASRDRWLVSAASMFQYDKDQNGASDSSWLREHWYLCKAFMQEAHIRIITDPKSTTDQVDEALKCVYADAGDLAKKLFKDAQGKITFEQYRRTCREAISELREMLSLHYSDIESTKVRLRKLAENFKSKWGSWSETPITLETTLFDDAITLKYNDWSFEWQYPMSALEKEYGLLAGFVKGFPWEKALRVAKAKDDMSAAPATLLKVNLARERALEYLGDGVQRMHMNRKCIEKHWSSIADKDACLGVEWAWLTQCCDRRLQEEIFSNALLSFPSASDHVKEKDVIVSLEELLASDLCKLCSVTVKEEVEGALDLVHSIQNREKVEGALPSDSAFYKDCLQQSAYFYSFTYAEALKHETELLSCLGAKKTKTVYGPLAVKMSLDSMLDQVERSEKILKGSVKRLTSFKFLFDDGQEWQFGKICEGLEKQEGCITSVPHAAATLAQIADTTPDTSLALVPSAPCTSASSSAKPKKPEASKAKIEKTTNGKKGGQAPPSARQKAIALFTKK